MKFFLDRPNEQNKSGIHRKSHNKIGSGNSLHLLRIFSLQHPG